MTLGKALEGYDSGESTLGDIKDYIEAARMVVNGEYYSNLRSGPVPSGFEQSDKVLEQSKRLHDAAYKELLGYWNDSNTEHFRSGLTSLLRAMQLATDTLDAMKVVEQQPTGANNSSVVICNDWSEAAKAAQPFSNEFHVNIDASTKLEHVAQSTGASAATLAAAFRYIRDGRQEMKRTSEGDFSSGLRRVGIKKSELDNADLPQVLGAISSHLKLLPDGGPKSIAVLELLGPEGPSLEPMMNLGPDGINKMGAEFEGRCRH